MHSNSPSGFKNSLKLGSEMNVCDTEMVGSKTQAVSRGWQVFIQRMVSVRWSLAALEEKQTHTPPREEKNTWQHTHRLTWRPLLLTLGRYTNIETSVQKKWLGCSLMFCFVFCSVLFFNSQGSRAAFGEAFRLIRNPVGRLRRLLLLIKLLGLL